MKAERLTQLIDIITQSRETSDQVAFIRQKLYAAKLTLQESKELTAECEKINASNRDTLTKLKQQQAQTQAQIDDAKKIDDALEAGKAVASLIPVLTLINERIEATEPLVSSPINTMYFRTPAIQLAASLSRDSAKAEYNKAIESIKHIRLKYAAILLDTGNMGTSSANELASEMPMLTDQELADTVVDYSKVDYSKA
jgi:hypothetical protein